MGQIHRTDEIELSDDLRFTQNSWIAERVGWALLGAILVAAFLGGLGPGLFSARTEAGRSLTVEYDRFGQFKTEGSVNVNLSTHPEDGGRVSLWIEQKFLDDVSIQEIRPHPLEMRSGKDRTTYVFAAPESDGAVRVRFHIVPEKPGRLAGRFGRENDGVDVRQYIYP